MTMSCYYYPQDRRDDAYEQGYFENIAEQLANLQMPDDGQMSQACYQPMPKAIVPQQLGLVSPWPMEQRPEPQFQQQHVVGAPFSPVQHLRPTPMVFRPTSPLTSPPTPAFSMPMQQYRVPIGNQALTPIGMDQSNGDYWQSIPPTPTPAPPVPTPASPVPTPASISPTVTLFPLFTGCFPLWSPHAMNDQRFIFGPRFQSEPNSPGESGNTNERRRSDPGKRSPVDGCTFCKRNGESREYYQGHQLRDENGKLLCPILRAFVCPICGATGDDAHTESYCPERPRGGPRSFGRTTLNRTATGKIKGRKVRNSNE